MQTLYVTKRAHLRVENEQIVLEGYQKVHVPIEDLSTVVLESLQVSITSACLARLAEQGCKVILCGRDHMPVALQLPFLPHSRQAMINRDQLKWTEAFKKRCRQVIIKKKQQIRPEFWNCLAIVSL